MSQGTNVKNEEIFWKALSMLLSGVLLFSIATIFHAPWYKPVFPNSDFEKGDLTNWKAVGDAFKNQPTFGDNCMYRSRGISNLRGNYWVGTFENRPSPRADKGETQGDAPTGELISKPFTIERDRLSFLIGGGKDSPAEGVALEVNGKIVRFVYGRGSQINSEVMSRVTWDVSTWKGQRAVIIIEDRSSDLWGHINADDFCYA
jgi:hypothetical protein